LLYMLIYRLDEQRFANLPPDDLAALWADCDADCAAMIEQKIQVGSGALQPSSTATVARERNGETFYTDGPFVETKEAIAGYQLIEVASREEAVTIAKRFPPLRLEGTSVEIRQVWDEPGERKRWTKQTN
jgi:hypothetical protein